MPEQIKKMDLERVIASGVMAQLSPGEQEMARQCAAEMHQSLSTVPPNVALAAFMQISIQYMDHIKAHK